MMLAYAGLGVGVCEDVAPLMADVMVLGFGLEVLTSRQADPDAA